MSPGNFSTCKLAHPTTRWHIARWQCPIPDSNRYCRRRCGRRQNRRFPWICESPRSCPIDADHVAAIVANQFLRMDQVETMSSAITKGQFPDEPGQGCIVAIGVGCSKRATFESFISRTAAMAVGASQAQFASITISRSGPATSLTSAPAQCFRGLPSPLSP